MGLLGHAATSLLAIALRAPAEADPSDRVTNIDELVLSRVEAGKNPQFLPARPYRIADAVPQSKNVFWHR
jgi:hypothetical protein